MHGQKIFTDMLKQNGIPRWEVTTTSTNHTTSWKLQIKLFLSNYVTKNLADFFRCAFIELWVHQGSLRKQKSHRRTGNFLPGGAVNQKLPKFLRKSRKEMRAILQQHRPSWHMKVARYSFSGSIPSLSINYVAINKHLEKLRRQLY